TSHNSYVLKFLTIVVTAIIIYYVIGYILNLFLKINMFIRATDDKDFQIDLLASFFVISIYLFILIIFPTEFKKIYGLSLFCLGITYLLTLRSLLRLMINPINIKNKNQDNVSFKRILTAALIILFMIIINLFLAVCTAYNVNINAYTNVNGYFSLFYYTIISFSTIGYGYIAPVSTLARAIAIVIAVTSILSLTIFISSILSYKDKFN
ncbi:MAG: ion channel, partial [Sarcina sp.]